LTPNAALVDYMADYGGKFAGELLQQKAHTARFGRDKATNGNSCTFRKQKWSEALDRGGDLTLDKGSVQLETTAPPNNVSAEPPRQKWPSG